VHIFFDEKLSPIPRFFFIFSVHCQKNKKDDDKKDEEFKCPEGQGNGNFADPATCRRFYQVIYTTNNLSDNNYISQHCSDFYYWSVLDYFRYDYSHRDCTFIL